MGGGGGLITASHNVGGNANDTVLLYGSTYSKILKGSGVWIVSINGGYRHGNILLWIKLLSIGKIKWLSQEKSFQDPLWWVRNHIVKFIYLL